MANRNTKPPEDNTRPAAPAEQPGEKPKRKRRKQITIDTQGDYKPFITPVPPTKEDQASALQAAETARRLQEESNNIAQNLLNPAIERIQRQQEIINHIAAGASQLHSPGIEAIQNMLNSLGNNLTTAAQRTAIYLDAIKTNAVIDTEALAHVRRTLEMIANAISTAAPAVLEFMAEIDELRPFLEEELKKPEYDGRTLDDLLAGTEEDITDAAFEDTLLMQAITAARAAKEAHAVIDAQNAGRQLRRQLKENAKKHGAVMELRGEILPVFSSEILWDAFSPGRISKMGELCRDAIDAETGRLETGNLKQGAIIPINALDISFKALMLLNSITANSVENYRQYFIQDGAITFYVKGVLDDLGVDPRIRNDMQLNFDRKTAGVLYLEKQLEPLLSLIGTAPDGSRYSILSYDGYNVDSDTMTIRTPYLFRLWKDTQVKYSIRKQARELRISEGKKPLKKDLKPLEVNSLFKTLAYKEDDAVLEIAVYITNILLKAGKGAHKTEISFKTLIKNCPRLQERLSELEALPNTEKLPDGKRRNNVARYNTELRKIAKAYNLIMDTDKCEALNHFQFVKFTPTKEDGGSRKLIPPTKSTLDGKIYIEWSRISTDHE